MTQTSESRQAEKLIRAYLQDKRKEPRLELGDFLAKVDATLHAEVRAQATAFEELRALLDTHTNSLKEGARLGDYRLIQEIGSGASSVVWLATQVSLRREVAIKLLRPQHALSKNAQEHFLQEARSLVAVHHPAVVRVLEVGQWNNLPFMVQEYAAQHDSLLGQLVAARQSGQFSHLRFELSAEIVAKVADGLQAAHEVGQGSMSGEFRGTPFYSSPEQTRSQAELATLRPMSPPSSSRR